MAPSRRQSNGRSPLVNQQSQITSFFSKSPSPSPSPSPVPSKQKPNPNPSPSPSPSPTTPSPLNPKRNKPLLVIGGIGGASSPSPPRTADKQSYGGEVIGKRIKVYWPLEKSWFEGCVKSFDKNGGKHVVEYEDGDEETLDLMNEKIEWIQETGRNLKRLRRGPAAFKGAVIEDEEQEIGDVEVDEEKEETDDGDDSSDEDWGKNRVVEDDEEDTDMELVDDKEDEENEAEKSKGKRGGKVATKKRKDIGVEKLGSAKKHKTDVDAGKDGFNVSVKESSSNSEGK